VLRTTPILLLGLLSACSAPEPTAPAPADPPPTQSADREPLIHVHVPDKVAQGQGSFKADWSFDLIASESWSAHVHVIPQHQLVPPHRHPENDELTFVASGKAEWGNWTTGGVDTFVLSQGEAMIAPMGTVHSVRNRKPEPLAAIVVHRPEFGQNWFVLPGEVDTDRVAGRFGRSDRVPGAFDGWDLTWVTDVDDPGGDADVLYLVGGGEGTLSFEETTLPMKPGTFVRVPPGLAHRIEGVTSAAIRIPRDAG